jgi:hypothetical protein
MKKDAPKDPKKESGLKDRMSDFAFKVVPKKDDKSKG